MGIYFCIPCFHCVIMVLYPSIYSAAVCIYGIPGVAAAGHNVYDNQFPFNNIPFVKLRPTLCIHISLEDGIDICF